MVKQHTLCLLLLVMWSLPGWAQPRAELLPGATPADWLLVIEADGVRQGNELEITPLLRQFAVGRVTMSRVSTPVQQLTRWQIPLHLTSQPDDPAGMVITPLKLGNEWTPELTLKAPAPQPTLPAPPTPAALEMEAQLDHQGPLYPGQPVIYRLTLWLPTTMQQPGLSELNSSHFIIRRLGSDEWLPPVQNGLPGRLTRSWLIQAKAPGLWLIDSPRLQGQLPQNGGQLQRLAARAAPLEVRVDQAPATPVASRLLLTQRIEPSAEGHSGEPLIRVITITLENGDSSQVQLAPLMAQQLPAGLQAHPDGEQQQERYREGKLLFEREWRQTLLAGEAGEYQLPAITLPWFNTAIGRIEQAKLPATRLVFQPASQQGAGESLPLANESLWWVLLALLLRGIRRNSPRWLAFYRLQRALASQQSEQSRLALRHWVSLSVSSYWAKPANTEQLQRWQAELNRACFAPSAPIVPWRTISREICHVETASIAQLLALIAHRFPLRG
ncbi:hypothetical protein [Aeromonas jandaei]|uniref:hypothetical protein n=1 Tax=Aeromonas jandaei TaxID=650 RepID=UPI0038B6998C